MEHVSILVIIKTKTNKGVRNSSKISAKIRSNRRFSIEFIQLTNLQFIPAKINLL